MRTVPALSIVFIAVSCLAGFAIPLVWFLYFRKKWHADIVSFFVAWLCWSSRLFWNRPFIKLCLVLQLAKAFGITSGWMAGLFEKTGRLVAFKTVLRNKNDSDINALMYGPGHGGFETAVLLGFAMISNLVMAVAINSGNVSAITGNASGAFL